MEEDEGEKELETQAQTRRHTDTYVQGMHS